LETAGHVCLAAWMEQSLFFKLRIRLPFTTNNIEYLKTNS